jgi:hypothetical protein
MDAPHLTHANCNLCKRLHHNRLRVNYFFGSAAKWRHPVINIAYTDIQDTILTSPDDHFRKGSMI